MNEKRINLPAWAELVVTSSGWEWQDGRLIQDGAVVEPTGSTPKKNNSLARFIVSHIYGRQNRTRTVRDTIASALRRLPENAYGLNFGAGESRLDQRMIGLDVRAYPGVDIVSNGSLEVPTKDSSLALIISQEVLEHVRDPHAAVREFHRVLSPGGELVLQLPFVIGYHPGPEDLWRFSTEAYAQLLSAERWEIVSKKISVGHGTGFHRIITEFVAVHFSIFGNKTYRAAKGAFAVIFAPFILFDALTQFLPEKDRIPGGYIVVARAIK